MSNKRIKTSLLQWWQSKREQNMLNWGIGHWGFFILKNEYDIFRVHLFFSYVNPWYHHKNILNHIFLLVTHDVKIWQCFRHWHDERPGQRELYQKHFLSKKVHLFIILLRPFFSSPLLIKWSQINSNLIIKQRAGLSWSHFDGRNSSP